MRSEIVRFHVDVRQGGGNLVEGEAPCRGTEQQVDDRGRPDANEEPRGHPDRQRGPTAIPANAPMPTTHRPMYLMGRAM